MNLKEATNYCMKYNDNLVRLKEFPKYIAKYDRSIGCLVQIVEGKTEPVPVKVHPDTLEEWEIYEEWIECSYDEAMEAYEEDRKVQALFEDTNSWKNIYTDNQNFIYWENNVKQETYSHVLHHKIDRKWRYSSNGDK